MKLPLQRLETGQGGAAAVRYKVDVNRHRFEKLRVDVPLNGRYGRVLDSMVAFESILPAIADFLALGWAWPAGTPVRSESKSPIVRICFMGACRI